MSERTFGNIPDKVRTLTRKMTDAFNKSLAEPAVEAHAKEFNDLCDQIEAHGFKVAVLAIQDDDGEVSGAKLAVYREGGGPVLN